MKFYYNGNLVRTSKNHIYTHAVVNTVSGKAIGCRANKENAEAIISSEIAQYERGIKNCESAIKALQSGKSGYYSKDGRRSWFCKFDPDRTVSDYEEWIESRRNRIEEIKATWKVVELEARS